MRRPVRRSGTMNERVTVQRRVRAADGGGGSTTTWQDVETLWAAVEPLRGSEVLDAGQVTAPEAYRVTIQNRPWDLAASHRLLWVGPDKLLNVRYAPYPGERADYRTVIAEAGVAQ